MNKFFSILILISCGIFSLSRSHPVAAEAPGDYKDFDGLYRAVLGYEVDGWNLRTTKYYPEDDSLDKEERVVRALISLSGNRLSRFLQKDREHPQALSPLEELYYKDLGHMAEQICDHFSKVTHLPPEILFLRQIYRRQVVKISKEVDSKDFLKAAYRVANQANNYPMVKELYSPSGVQESFSEFERSSPALLSPELNPIHEPYWMYNIVQLKAYGERIIGTIKPYYISQEQVRDEGANGIFITSHDEKIVVRKVGFGSVLPNLYLKRHLKHNTRLGVPRIFILPRNKKTEVTFTFLMPYSKTGKPYIVTGNTGYNPMQVFCDSFEVYQEYVQGTGNVGDRAFLPYGHVDFNAIQVVVDKAGKRYLIDTKEQKNFFPPYLSPFSDFNPSDAHLMGIIKAYGKKHLPEEKNEQKIFEAWKKDQQRIIFLSKSLNFDPRMIYVTVQVDPSL